MMSTMRRKPMPPTICLCRFHPAATATALHAALLNQADKPERERRCNLRRGWLMFALLTLAAVLLPAGARAQWKTQWTYEGAAHWSDLDPDYAACNAGREQSPVDIQTTEKAELPHSAALGTYAEDRGQRGGRRRSRTESRWAGAPRHRLLHVYGFTDGSP